MGRDYDFIARLNFQQHGGDIQAVGAAHQGKGAINPNVSCEVLLKALDMGALGQRLPGGLHDLRDLRHLLFRVTMPAQRPINFEIHIHTLGREPPGFLINAAQMCAELTDQLGGPG